MSARKILGIILFLVGIYLLAMGGQSNGQMCDESCDRGIIRNEFSGRSSQNDQGSYIGGIVLLIVGAGLFLYDKKKRKKK